MERRLAEAANACRARRTRGETGLRRFFWIVFFWLGLVADALLLPDFVDLTAGFGDEVEDAGGVDCATAD